MSLFPDSNAAWAALIIVLLPLLIIGAGELQERLRQRDSRFQPAVSTLRVWVVPLLTVWVLARALLDVSADNVLLRFLGSAIIVSAAIAALSAVRVVAAELTDDLDEAIESAAFSLIEGEAGVGVLVGIKG